MDGTGKSTLVERLTTVMGSVAVSSIWDIMNGDIRSVPFRSRRDIDHYLCELTSGARWLFLVHAWQQSLDVAQSKGHSFILLNGYYYKYAATELALGLSPGWVGTVSRLFPVPDLVIDLQVPTEQAAGRKTTFSRYECGLSSTPGADDFICFQRKVKEKWNFFDRARWQAIDSRQTPDEVFVQTLSYIQNL